MCMRTMIDIDERLMADVMRLTGVRTKREAVDFALREFVARHSQVEVLSLRGRVSWVGDLESSRRARL